VILLESAKQLGGRARGVHADHHALWIDPRDGRHQILGCDGGVYVTYDRGTLWDHLNHVAIGQFYNVAVGPRRNYRVYGGLQDNGSWLSALKRDDVELITENGLAEGATVAPGEEVTATWQIRNTGTCTWGDGYSWVFTGGEPVTIVSTSGAADVAPGESTEVVAVFVAPAEPGRYAAQWQLQSPSDLEPLGTPAFVLFVVES